MEYQLSLKVIKLNKFDVMNILDGMKYNKSAIDFIDFYQDDAQEISIDKEIEKIINSFMTGDKLEIIDIESPEDELFLSKNDLNQAIEKMYELYPKETIEILNYEYDNSHLKYKNYILQIAIFGYIKYED